MTDATAQFFGELESRGHDPRLAKVRGTLRFDLADAKRTTRWLVAVDRGAIAVSHRNAKADCVIRADKATFDGIAAGEVNAFASVLRGALRVDGERELLVLFQRLFPGPPGRRA
jgi:putative sterol carrier protein